MTFTNILHFVTLRTLPLSLSLSFPFFLSLTYFHLIMYISLETLSCDLNVMLQNLHDYTPPYSKIPLEILLETYLSDLQGFAFYCLSFHFIGNKTKKAFINAKLTVLLC